MISTHPRGLEGIFSQETRRRANLTKDELVNSMKNDEALVQISLFPGLTAYRRGGWETEGSTLEKVVYEKGCEEGIRKRVLVKGWVSCRWGLRRVVRDGGPGVGFVEFFPAVNGIWDCEFVRDVGAVSGFALGE